MKKSFLFVLCIVAIIPMNVNASQGALKKDSIKTCPNGITYGFHGKTNGHWHVAITNGDSYYPDGEAIYSDPCPGYNKNEGTAGPTNGGSSWSNNNTDDNNNNNNNNNNNDYNTDYNQSNYYTIDNTSVATKDTEATDENKSNDTSIKSIKIDNNSISIKDTMSFTTSKSTVKIEITPSDTSAKVEYSNDKLKIGNNIINIKVLAENGDIKIYNLNIKRDIPTIKKFTLGNDEVKFNDNKATINKLKNESTIKYYYELSDTDAKLTIYHNNEVVENLDNLKNDDIIKIIVTSDDNIQNSYEIIVKDYPFIFTILVYFYTVLVVLSPIIVITGVIVYKKFLKRKNFKIKTI